MFMWQILQKKKISKVETLVIIKDSVPSEDI